MTWPIRRTGEHVVKPRWVWGGLVVALVGGSLVVLGMSTASLAWAICGAALLLVGASLAGRGGILHDAYRTPSQATEELAQALAGGEHQGVAPGEMVDNPDAQRDARRTAHTARALLAESYATPAPEWSPVAGWLLVLVTLVLVAPQWYLVAHDATGRANSFRDTGLAVLIGLAGLRFVVASGRHLASGGIAALAGVGLVLGGLLADHHRAGLAGYEVLCGAVTIGAVAAAWARPSSIRSPKPDASDAPAAVRGVAATGSASIASHPIPAAVVDHARRESVVRIGLTVIVVLLVGLREALRGHRHRAGSTRDVRYEVPAGQDPARLLGALRIDGFGARPEIVRGEPTLVIPLDAPSARERARRVLREAEEKIRPSAVAPGHLRFSDES